jgi:hypothetical protein
MKHTDHQLNRLLRAASRAPEASDVRPSQDWVKSVLSACQAKRQRVDEELSETVLKWSLTVACIIVALTMARHHSTIDSQLPEVVSVANTGIAATLAP